MSIRNFLNRFLDSEFGVYPATRGAVVVMPTLTARPVIIRTSDTSEHAEVSWPGRDWATAHGPLDFPVRGRIVKASRPRFCV